jgi:hypothetical protein
MKRQMSWALLTGGIALAASTASARTRGRGDQRERNGHGHHRDLERVGTRTTSTGTIWFSRGHHTPPQHDDGRLVLPQPAQLPLDYSLLSF